MTIEDITKIEETLEINFSAELKEKYITPELDELDQVETLGLEGILEIKIRDCFIRDPDKLIRINLRLRKKGLFKKVFDKNHFAIGYAWKTDYYFIDLRDFPAVVYCAMNNKTWTYSPDNLSSNILIPPEPGLDSFLETYILHHLNSAKERKARQDAGIPERVYSVEQAYDFLDKLRNGESVDEYIGDQKK